MSSGYTDPWQHYIITSISRQKKQNFLPSSSFPLVYWIYQMRNGGIKMQAENTQRLTEGVIWKQILFFSLPIIAGNLFQWLYNTVDSIVVGNFVGGEALASVGAGTSVINLLIGLFSGLTTGAGVIVAKYFGAGLEEKLRRSIHTSSVFTIVFGLFMTILGILSSDWILRAISTPSNVLDGANLYLRIYFAGIIPMMIYNMGAAILRAVGDSKTPLYYLGVSSIINIVLDIVFVSVFRMGIAGVGIATVIAQIVSAILVVLKLARSKEVYRLEWRLLKADHSMLLEILKVGIPVGIQQTIIGFSNIFVQYYINLYGSAAMAAWVTFNKIDGLVFLPVLSFGVAITTFTSQNVGAGKPGRVLKGTHVTLLMNILYAAVSSFFFFLAAEPITRIFTNEADIIQYGMRMIRTLIPFYVLTAFMQVLSNVISGAGYSFASMMVMIGNLCIVRVLYLMIMTPRSNDIATIFQSYIITWVTCAICLLLYYRKGGWRKSLHANA